MQALYILKTGSTLPDLAHENGDFEDWIIERMGATSLPILVIDAKECTKKRIPWPEAAQIAGVIVTGSHDMVTDDAPWIAHTRQWLRALAHQQVPLLGICFGHQLLAQALGGHVSVHPGGLELGSVNIHTLQRAAQHDPLWSGMPTSFAAHAVHYQSVRTLPAGAQVLAGNAHEPHHAFRWGAHAWGVQFHPEFSAPAMQAYVDHLNAQLHHHELGNGNAQWHVKDTRWAHQLLPRFAQYAERHTLHAQQPMACAA